MNPANTNDATNVTYSFSSTGIAWPGESKKYVDTPIGNGYSSFDEIKPPPNWAKQFPDGYNSTNVPNLKTNEHFQNWMRTAGLPTFSKLYGRNDVDTMQQGRYQIVVGLSRFALLATRHVTKVQFRLSCSSLQGHEIDCDLHCFLDWR